MAISYLLCLGHMSFEIAVVWKQITLKERRVQKKVKNEYLLRHSATTVVLCMYFQFIFHHFCVI